MAAPMLSDLDFLHDVIQASPDAVVIADAETGMLLDANHRALEWVGRSLDEVRAMHQSQLHPARIAPQSRENFRNHVDGDPTKPMTDVLLSANGSQRPVEVMASPMVVNGRKVLVGWFRDISGRDQSQRAFAEVTHESHRHADALAQVVADLTGSDTAFRHQCRAVTETVAGACEVARVSVWLLEADGSFLDCISLFEHSRHHDGMTLVASDYPAYFTALTGPRAVDAHDARTDPRTNEFAEGYLEPLGISSMLDAQLRIGGNLAGVLCLEHIGSPRRWSPAEVAFAASVADQLSIQLANHRSAELLDQLAASEGHLRTTLASIADGVITCGNDWCITALNPVACELLGCDADAAMGQRVDDMLSLLEPGTHRPLLVGGLGEGGQWRDLPVREPVLQTPDGQHRRVTITCSPIRQDAAGTAGNVMVLRDVTEQVTMEERLRHSQKMDAVGQLAGGVAHDFNNMLGGILGAAELLEMRADKDPRTQRLLNTVITAAKRASDLTSKLLSFSRKTTVHITTVDMHEVIADAVALLTGTAAAQIDVATELNADAATVSGDPSELQSAILNLAINARDAMAHDDGGALTVTTETIHLDRAACDSSGFDLNPGRYLEVAVSDTGCGIPDDVRDRIFEPFFSTKPVGAGTGLGLAAVYGIIIDHSASIDVTSDEGVGTTFTLRFPLSDQSEDVFGSGEYEGLPGTACILVVDDEPAIRTAAEFGLQDYGFEVLIAADGVEGLELWREHRERIDLVLLDVVMPRMGGCSCWPQCASKTRPSARS